VIEVIDDIDDTALHKNLEVIHYSHVEEGVLGAIKGVLGIARVKAGLCASWRLGADGGSLARPKKFDRA
jgi:hemoglobin-like flavoprotein